VASERAPELAPAGIGLALLVTTVVIRMDEPWANGVLLLVAAVPAVTLLALGLAAARPSDTQSVATTMLLVAGLVLAALAIGRLGQLLTDGDFAETGGTLTWMLAAFTVLAAFCAWSARSVACLLIAALAAVGLVLEAVNWIFDTENVDTFRALLAVSFAALFCAGLAVPGRAGTILVGAAGVALLALGAVAGGIFLVFAFEPGGIGWGWEFVMLVEALSLLAYAAVRLEPGPAYLAFFGLALFATTAALNGDGGESEDHSLIGWPLALAIGTVAAALWGLRRPRQSP
jgi:hypothetical protein